MQATTTELFLVAMVMIFAVPWLFWRLLRTDRIAPLAIVQIVGGIILGPAILGGAFPEAHAAIFTPQVIGALNGVAWWAVMLFVFVAGVELDLHHAWTDRRESATTAGLALAVPLLFGAAAAAFLLQFPGWAGPQAAHWQVILGLGMACAVTALPILVVLMERMSILRTALGQRILRYASLDDIAIWAVLAIILLDWQRLERQAIFLATFAVSAFLVRKLFQRVEERDRWALSLIWLAMVGLVADWSGLHYMVGAFLAGAVIDARWFDRDRFDQFRDTVLLTIMPVFFLSTGLRTQWDMGGLAVIGAAALLLAASVGGKLLGVAMAGRALGWQKGDARLIGWMLQTKALIEIIFANILLDRGVITASTFTALLLMAVASTLLTTPVVRPMLARRRAAEGDAA